MTPHPPLYFSYKEQTMALTWDLTAVKDSKELCWVTDRNDKDKVEMSAVTNTLVWSTMLIGINSITEKTSKAFYRRLIEFEVIHGKGFLVEDGNFRQPTLEEVRLHIGLKTNATVMDNRKWGNNLKRLVKEVATERIQKYQTPDKPEAVPIVISKNSTAYEGTNVEDRQQAAISIT